MRNHFVHVTDNCALIKFTVHSVTPSRAEQSCSKGAAIITRRQMGENILPDERRFIIEITRIDDERRGVQLVIYSISPEH